MLICPLKRKKKYTYKMNWIFVLCLFNRLIAYWYKTNRWDIISACVVGYVWLIYMQIDAKMCDQIKYLLLYFSS